jgi:hypothetical protein
MAEYKTEFKELPDGGSLRANTTKKTEKSPDYWGTLAVNIKDMTNAQMDGDIMVIKLSGWKKQDKKGHTFLSLAVNRFVPEGQAQANRQSQQPAPQDFSDDDIPF